MPLATNDVKVVINVRRAAGLSDIDLETTPIRRVTFRMLRGSRGWVRQALIQNTT